MATPSMKKPKAPPAFVEEVEVQGHIVDSLILPKILDEIQAAGGWHVVKEFRLGQRRVDPSYCLLEIHAPSAEVLERILAKIGDHGANPVHATDCTVAPADIEGAFPEGFYSTTNQRTQVRHRGRWIDVEDQEMDCGIALDASAGKARTIPMIRVHKGDQLVVGRQGVRVFPLEKEREPRALFEFMTSAVSSEKPKGVTVRAIAAELRRTRQEGGKILVVAGPAVVHTGSVGHFCRMIRDGYVQVLFAGNALAAHDIEQALYGTSLGVDMERGLPTEEGHQHHLRAINTIRRIGSIRRAVETGVLASGIMYECVRHGVEVVLAGSIRDDGPLPEVITDTMQAQDTMREKIRGVSFCLMIATTLHSIAVGNMLPAWVKVVSIDINPATVTKLTDRGTFQTVGLVTDVEPFMRALVAELIGDEGSRMKDES